MKFLKTFILSAIILSLNSYAFGQTYIKDIVRDSARSDTRTGGNIETSALETGENGLKITANVPAFQMTLWQNGKEVKNYSIGVGLKDHPIYIGLREINMVIWNPEWIPPDSDWVAPSLRGQIIKPTDPRNPLGKIKIPLGYNYLIHQAKGKQDLGNLVSHGCMRVMRNDLYDLNDKIIAAYSLDITAQQIAKAKRTKETFLVELNEKMPVEITYDTMVVEDGILHIYPDVYELKKNTVENLRKELKANNVDETEIDDATLKKMIALAKSKKQYVISLENIENGTFKGTVLPVL